MRRLEARVAFVTGGNTGIGAAVVRRLAAEGAAVGVGYFEDPEAAGSLADDLRASGGPAVAARCDVRDGESVDAAVASVTASLGPIDTLVNNAAVLRSTPFPAIDEGEWRWVFETNVAGTYRCIRACLPAMLERGAGCIVNVASELALVGEPLLVHYAAFKAAILGLTKALAREVGPCGVRVNTVAPGPTDTRLLTEESGARRTWPVSRSDGWGVRTTSRRPSRSCARMMRPGTRARCCDRTAGR